MMYRTVIFMTFLCVLTACEMDSFLFNEEAVSHYELPGNTIPDSLLKPVSFTSGDNTLYGYMVLASQLERGMTVLYCHGNKHNIDEYWDRVMILHRLGVNVFIFDYRGFGRSEGEPSNRGLQEDGTAAAQYLISEWGISADSICLYGYSLGCVAALHVASEVITPLCVIVECPFASASSLTQASLSLDFPSRWLTDGEFDNVEAVRNIHAPVLVLHGSDDDFVRYRDNGKIVYENAPDPKSLVLVEKAGHTDIPYVLGIDAYLRIVWTWIERSMQQ